MTPDDRAAMSPRERKLHDLKIDRDGFACAAAQALLANDVDQARIEAEAYGRAAQQINEFIRGESR
ncbi:MAG TPA: hypothetical protein VK059_00520 [Nocardioidaceae bacterium]|nr:hypothetical protein [Nocardioidaceae bacterium]